MDTFDPAAFKFESEKKFKENQNFFNRLKRKKPKGLDDYFHDAHDEVFEQINCLTCANCC